MAQWMGGDSSLQDRRQEQIGVDRSSSLRTSSGGGAGNKGFRITQKLYCPKKKKTLEKVLLGCS